MIRFAKNTDIPTILELLRQVNLVHYEGRPDIFKLGTKYGEKELEEILSLKDKPILVYVDKADNDLRLVRFSRDGKKDIFLISFQSMA